MFWGQWLTNLFMKETSKFIYVFSDDRLLQNRYWNLDAQLQKKIIPERLLSPHAQLWLPHFQKEVKIMEWARRQAKELTPGQTLHVSLTEFNQLTNKVQSCHNDYLGPHFKLTCKLRAGFKNFSLHFPAKFPSNVSKLTTEEFSRAGGQFINAWSFQNEIIHVYRSYTPCSF